MDLDGVKWDSVVHFQNGRYEVGKFHQVSIQYRKCSGKKSAEMLVGFLWFSPTTYIAMGLTYGTLMKRSLICNILFVTRDGSN